MKRSFYIDHNPRAANHATPYIVAELIGGQFRWWSRAFGSQDAAVCAVRDLCPAAEITVR